MNFADITSDSLIEKMGTHYFEKASALLGPRKI